MWDSQLLSILSDVLSPPEADPSACGTAAGAAANSRQPGGGTGWGAAARERRAPGPGIGGWGGWGRAQQALFGGGVGTRARSSASSCGLARPGGAPSDAAASSRRRQRTPAPSPADLARRAAQALARAAHFNASDASYRSPWSVAAGGRGVIARLFSRGGKMDDCTCVVALVADARQVVLHEHAGPRPTRAAAGPAGP
ncbi:hypothetical protein MNEG_11072 [Monoraphidium neglectum]|jgi:hypothetical protein|uniref:Uncharacterized protein n=1 Tax=Monoraphidium neglectum TaxID=145388 RepID=A0A0D2JAX2_9CHLO|nr:hypothetical protein MNEG_11072 [Monoraphidium neglectum]KIY96887.1 hypothetical protein MNEG_11072 [Monoraphidium neglectum]|eukprot:XP_013895907.1 hypothetical protein MNEG_11072 [Monoraphidium neglectum]